MLRSSRKVTRSSLLTRTVLSGALCLKTIYARGVFTKCTSAYCQTLTTCLLEAHFMGKKFTAATVVVQFGSQDANSILQAIQALSGVRRLDVEIASATSGFNYHPSGLNVTDAFELLAADEVQSLLISPAEEQAEFFAMVFCPYFDGDASSYWYGTFELKTGYTDELINTVRQIPRVDFVAVSLEDDLDLSDVEQVTKETFPWADWRLIEAVVADGQDLGSQQIKKGPAAQWLRQ